MASSIQKDWKNITNPDINLPSRTLPGQLLLCFCFVASTSTFYYSHVVARCLYRHLQTRLMQFFLLQPHDGNAVNSLFFRSNFQNIRFTLRWNLQIYPASTEPVFSLSSGHTKFPKHTDTPAFSSFTSPPSSSALVIHRWRSLNILSAWKQAAVWGAATADKMERDTARLIWPPPPQIGLLGDTLVNVKYNLTRRVALHYRCIL